jgi:hypothetical protein
VQTESLLLAQVGDDDVDLPIEERIDGGRGRGVGENGDVALTTSTAAGDCLARSSANVAASSL